MIDLLAKYTTRWLKLHDNGNRQMKVLHTSLALHFISLDSTLYYPFTYQNIAYKNVKIINMIKALILKVGLVAKSSRDMVIPFSWSLPLFSR